MPISEYFGGHGKEVMRGMKKRYGARGEEVFYRTANKRGQKPKKRKFLLPSERARGKRN